MFSSPTAIRVLKKQDPAYMKQHDISSAASYLFLAGEPLDEPTARWASDALGVAIVDNYWQTETGWPILSAQLGRRGHAAQVRLPVVPGRTATTCGCCDEATGAEVGDGREGRAGDRAAAAAGLHDDGVGRRRALRADTYFTTFPDELVYSTFDWATRDADGYYFVLGRTDDVINVAGHRLGTREIEEAVQAHAGIAEVAVVGVADPLKGQVPVAFAVVKDPARVATPEAPRRMRKEVMDTVDRELGAIARPGAVHFVTLLPKTRSGKLLRRSIQALAEGRDPGDLTTIEDPGRAGADPRGARRHVARGRDRRRRHARRSAYAGRVRTGGGYARISDNAGLPRYRMPQFLARLTSRSPSPRAAAPSRACITAPVAVVDRDGRVLFAAGDPQVVTFTRSALKPLQALPFVARRRARALRLSARRRSRCCARATRASRGTSRPSPTCSRRPATTPDDLQCGTHAPGFYEARGEVPPPPPYSPLAHNCSGKHSGHARLLRRMRLRASTTTSRSEHPLQREIRARGGRVRPACRRTRCVAGIDGCSAPNYAMPLARSPWPSRGSRPPTTIAIYGRAPRHAGRRDDRASGNGVGRAAAATSR